MNEAIAEDRAAIDLDPKHVNAHNNLGWALNEKGRYDEAIPILRKAIDLDPKHVNAHRNLGDALDGKGQVNEAIADIARPSISTPSTSMPTTTSARREQEGAV